MLVFIHVFVWVAIHGLPGVDREGSTAGRGTFRLLTCNATVWSTWRSHWDALLDQHEHVDY
eukprot:2220273-Amphidinium_carterae.1